MIPIYKTYKPRCDGLMACVALVTGWCLFITQPALAEPMVGELTKSQYESLFTATTHSGTHLSGSKSLKVFGDYMLPLKPDWLRRNRLRCGVFKMHVQANGTVSRVEVIRSVGDPNFYKQIASMFKKVRCKPNTVKEIQIPAYYN